MLVEEMPVVVKSEAAAGLSEDVLLPVAVSGTSPKAPEASSPTMNRTATPTPKAFRLRCPPLDVADSPRLSPSRINVDTTPP